ncbi:MAG: PliI family lysozyme inhibitor of I-type lysozyme [Gammaproteobacteria bacterium]
MHQHRITLLLTTLVASCAAGTAETDRFVQNLTLPTGQMIVVTEGEFEPRSVGSYSVRLYSAANPRFPMDDFQAGLVQARDGYLDRTVLADIDGDQHKEVIVIARSAGTSGYLSAQAFSIGTSTIVLRSSVADLPANADPIAALGQALAADTEAPRHF